MRPYPRKFYQSARLRHFIAGAVASFLLFSFFVGVVGCDRTNGVAGNDPRGVDVEVDVRPAPCDSTMYTSEPPVTERREVDPNGNVRVKVTVRTCCCCGMESGPVRPIGITGTGPGGGGTTPPPKDPEPEPPVYSLLDPVPPGTPGYDVGPPPFVPTTITTIPPPTGGGVTSTPPWWISLVAAPLAFLSGDGGEDFPDGVLCGSDSGLPTGPNRPRCN